MSDPSPRPLKEIYLAASEIPDAEERARFLDTACAGDASLRANVEAVLGADTPDDFLDTPPVPANLTETIPVSGDAVGYFGDYVLLGEIARGSTGVVFRARQVSLNRVVAVKILRDAALLSSPAEERRFRAEAEAAAGLDHPGIVPIYEVGRHEGRGYFSMKLIEGGTLQFHSGEFREPRNAAALMAKVARAVHHAHQKGILHRDLKPGNILLDRNGEPLVADFGTARQLGVESGLTYTGQIIGTPHYMAPEQARGENRGLTPASDIYSLGAILYELLAGRRAFDGDTMLTLLKQVTEQPPPPLRLADRDLENIIMRCMEKAPAARYGSAAALAEDLERWLRGEPVHARPVGLPMRIAKWARRRPAHAALAAVLTVLAAGAAVFAFKNGQPPAVVAAPAASTVPEPTETAAYERRAAEWVLRTGKFSWVVVEMASDHSEKQIKFGEALPDGAWRLVKVEVQNSGADRPEPVTEEAFVAHLNGLTGLRHLGVADSILSTKAFDFLARNPGLQAIAIAGVPVSDDIFTTIRDLRMLTTLQISHTRKWSGTFTGRGLEHLASRNRLETVTLAHSHFDDTGAAALAKFPSIHSLGIAGTAITDVGLRSLHELQLGWVSLLVNPGITPAGLEAFKKARPGCHLEE